MNTPLAVRFPILLGLIALICFAGGCRRDQDNVPPAASIPAIKSSATSDATQMEGRLTAALAISDTIKRDEALRAVADQAASAADAPTVKKAVLQISDTIKKDDTIGSSVLTLAKAGKRSEAADIARMMSDTIKRDDTLSKLAEK